jgi:hypothetical protein
MENLIKYLYNKHVHSKDNNVDAFCRGEGVKLYMLSQEQIDFYSAMFVRNVFHYSAAAMEIKLSFKNLFAFMRLHKFEAIAK